MDEHEEYTGIELDERAVRVLAHPLRSRLLGRLRHWQGRAMARLARGRG